ncbi:lipid droplet-associated protein [Amycolatopsis ultiminotia]|uniref:Lipid droplet-associated protein n=1 Tax=Amycolatopsis ultiminotia TaxID=543629 RepID=A0ABP6XSI1_9PSEU
MKPLPLPLRVAAGLAVTTAERVRELPKQLTGLPVTVVSQVLQLSMRVQQQVTELAIKGDDALSVLRPVEDTPSWATFDEDAEPDLTPARPKLVPVDDLPQSRTNGHRTTAPDLATAVADDIDDAEPADPWVEETRALAEDHADGENDSAGKPAGLTGYDEFSLPQLRARLRRFTVPELEELLAYEKAHADRASFVGMLARRIANARKAAETSEGGSGDPAEGQ